MSQGATVIVVLCLLGLGSVGGALGSDGATPQTAPLTDELDANETATLWSKAPNTCLSGDVDAENGDETPDATDDELTALQELGSCTDITFKTPPDTAERWTESVHRSMTVGDAETSVYPAHATLTQSGQIADAHATFFAIHPSTRTHINDTQTTHYIAPEGTIRGVVDYRLRPGANETVETHGVSEVRLLRDGDVVATVDGTQTPALEYAFEEGGAATLSLEADIEARIAQSVGDQTTVRTDRVTVSQEIEIEVYDLEASVYYAKYPDGDDGVAIYHSQPWHGYTLTEERAVSVRGVWRYYTARDTNWDELTHATATTTDTTTSTDRPVYVHAYPSEMGPRAAPIRGGPEILEVWGTVTSSPAPTLHENVEIEVVSERYTRSDGMALRDEEIDRDAFAVAGIVRGTSAEIIEPAGGAEREIRASELSLDIVESNATAATVRVELRDAHTGLPIMLESPLELDRFSLISLDATEEYVLVGDQRVQTDILGRAEVTLTQPGVHSATYEPASWRTHDPAYLGDSASVTWHPLATATGWFTLLVDIVRYAIPVLVVLYAAKRLGAFLRIRDSL